MASLFRKPQQGDQDTPFSSALLVAALVTLASSNASLFIGRREPGPRGSREATTWYDPHTMGRAKAGVGVFRSLSLSGELTWLHFPPAKALPASGVVIYGRCFVNIKDNMRLINHFQEEALWGLFHGRF